MHTPKATCYHCGEPIPQDFTHHVTIENIDRDMCCYGCSAVAQAIVDNNLTGYYRHRTEKGVKATELVPQELLNLQSYDLTEIEQEFTQTNGSLKEVILTVENVTCAACAWLIERKLTTLPGIIQSSVNTSSARLTLKWQSEQLKLSEILLALAEIGYKAYPFKADIAEKNEVAATKSYLRRLVVAGLATMQVMMFAMATYFDVMGTLSDNLNEYFRYISLLISLPVVFYASSPFYKNALSALFAKRLNMDVPVSLAILLAFSASAYATITQQGDIYFESVCMFAFFLLLGRYLEQITKRKAAQNSSNLLKLIPSTATLINQIGKEQTYKQVPAKTLKRDQYVLIKPGEIIPADGVITKGTSQCNEAILTGEQLPINKTLGDWVYASTINHDQVIEVQVKQERSEQLISKIIALQEQATLDKPKLATLADKLSQYVVFSILFLSGLTYLGWWLAGNNHALWSALAVLVATCPCALSLATPSAYTAATSQLQQLGLLVKQGNSLDVLTQLTHICFDKTGTLTTGSFVIKTCNSIMDQQPTLAIIAAIESQSTHPIASAFKPYFDNEFTVNNVENFQGGGLSAIVNNQQYYLGSYEFINNKASISSSIDICNTNDVVIYLATPNELIATLSLNDDIRPASKQLINQLHSVGIRTTLLTGDNSKNANYVAQQLNINHVEQGQSPQDKLSYLKSLQNNNAVVAMFGDGVNDAPVLSQAHLSFAMNNGADIAKSSADIVLLHDDLSKVVSAITLAKKTKRIITQNFCWALGYNLTAVPFAIMGLLPPYLAAIGMSLSSIIVVSNSLRLLKDIK